MRRTKILCTIGPASESHDTLLAMAKAGMNIARFNFSHGTVEDHTRMIAVLEKANSLLSVPIATMVDLQGPVIRLGAFEHTVTLIRGEKVTITSREVTCTKDLISLSYPKLGEAVKPGDSIYIADGTIELLVTDISGTEATCEVVEGGEIGTHKNVSIPQAKVDLPAISEKDIFDIGFAAQHTVDFIAQSFVRSAEDIRRMKELLRQHNSEALVIAKIECQEAMDNLDEIIKAADAIMVARGDLGVQIPIEEVPYAQKTIIRKSNLAGKPVIVATQMLESMTHNPRPTRAEVTDVANALLDGADAVMLSAETAIGLYPLRVVETLAKVIDQTESHMTYAQQPYSAEATAHDSVAQSACMTAGQVKASAILCWTLSGNSAQLISRQRPKTPIIAATPTLQALRRLNLWWGVHPFLIEQPQSTDRLIDTTIKSALDHHLIEKGDTVVLVAGLPFTSTGNLNLMKVHVV